MRAGPLALRLKWIAAMSFLLAACAPPGDCGFGPLEDNTDDPGCREEREKNGRGATVPIAWIVRGNYDQDRSCGVCGYSQVLINNTSTTVVVNVRERRWHDLGKEGWAYTRVEEEKLAPNEKRFLGCTGATEVGSISCVVSFEWQIVSSRRANILPKLPPHFSYFAALSPLLSPEGVTVSIAPGPIGCAAECAAGDPSALCEIGRAPSEHSSALQSLVARAIKPSTVRISNVELIEMFGQADTDCMRSDTVFGDDRFINGGDQCLISAALPQLDARVDISIPRLVQGAITRKDGGVYVLFNEQAESPSIKIEDEALNTRFGGALQSIDATTSRVYFGTSNGCIAVDLTPAP